MGDDGQKLGVRGRLGALDGVVEDECRGGDTVVGVGVSSCGPFLKYNLFQVPFLDLLLGYGPTSRSAPFFVFHHPCSCISVSRDVCFALRLDQITGWRCRTSQKREFLVVLPAHGSIGGVSFYLFIPLAVVAGSPKKICLVILGSQGRSMGGVSFPSSCRPPAGVI